MLALALLAAPNGGYGEQLIILALGWLLGVLFLGLCELSLLGYLKLKELAAAWRAQTPKATPDDNPTPRPSGPPPAAQVRPLRPVTPAAPAASRAAAHNHHNPAYAALRRHAGYDRDDPSA